MEASVKENIAEVNVSVLDDVAIKYKETDAKEGKKLYFFAKRAFDIVSSLLALVVLAIPMLVIGIIIKIDSQGPAIYSQERVGKGGEPYTMYKFRSMRVDAEKNGPEVAAEHDNRCTRVGEFIRLYHIDELPQLMNVLLGHMSIVGPRPEREYYYNIIEQSVPNFRERLQVKPGLTGLAQVKGAYDIPYAEKLELDKQYIENMNILFDLRIMFETIGVVLKHKGVH